MARSSEKLPHPLHLRVADDEMSYTTEELKPPSFSFFDSCSGFLFEASLSVAKRI